MIINIIENVVSQEYADFLQNVVENSEMPFFYNKGTMYGTKPVIEVTTQKDAPQFVHGFHRDGQITSEWWRVIEPLHFNFVAKAGLVNPKNLIKCKANLNYKDTSYSKNEHYQIHTDNEKDCITAIYYINDADGDTLIFDEKGNVIERYTPKKNTIIYFDSKTLHAGQPPLQSFYRSVINFNWTK